MELLKKQLTGLLWKYASEVHGEDSCGEIGESFMAINVCHISDIADEILQKIEPQSSKNANSILTTENARQYVALKHGCESWEDLCFLYDRNEKYHEEVDEVLNLFPKNPIT